MNRAIGLIGRVLRKYLSIFSRPSQAYATAETNAYCASGRVSSAPWEGLYVEEAE